MKDFQKLKPGGAEGRGIVGSGGGVPQAILLCALWKGFKSNLRPQLG